MISNHPKTLFDDLLDNSFLCPYKSGVKPSEIESPVLSDTFYVCTSNSRLEYQQYIFDMYGGIIVCRRVAQRNEIAYMNVEYSFMKKTRGILISGIPYYGIKLIKKRTYEELLHHDEKVIDKWYQALSSYCVLTKFRHSFETIKVLGKGNFAKVYLVKRLADGKLFAAKVFYKAAIMKNAMEQKCLKYEIKMMKEINHYRVLKLHEIYEGENYIYCLCDYYDGDHLLNAIIKKGPQPESKALTITFQILEALNYLHKKKIMHRDVKPENIIFKRYSDIDIALVDLGFASFEADYRKLFVRCGTPGYVAPEILLDKPYSTKIDVYSCGIILYMIITGRSPYFGKSYKEVASKNLRGEINFGLQSLGFNVSTNSKFISYKSP